MKFHCALFLNWGIGAEVLRFIHASDQCRIGAVFTDCRPEAKDPWQNAVFITAQELGCPVICTRGLSLEHLTEKLQEARPDLALVHGFKRIMPRSMFTVPSRGTVNIHPSLLPAYRGPSPTYWVLKNHETKTGLTCHYIDDGVDTGKIIHQEQVNVFPDDTIESVIERLKSAVPSLMRVTLKCLADPAFRPCPQDESLACYAPRPPAPE